MTKKTFQSKNVVGGDLAAGDIYKLIYNINNIITSDLSVYSEKQLEAILYKGEKRLKSGEEEIERACTYGEELNYNFISALKDLDSKINKLKSELYLIQCRLLYPMDSFDNRIAKAIERGKNRREKLIRKKDIRNSIIAIISVVLIIMIIIFLMSLNNNNPNKKSSIENTTKKLIIQNIKPFNFKAAICYFNLDEDWIIRGWRYIEEYKSKEIPIKTNLNYFYFYYTVENGEKNKGHYQDKDDIWLRICDDEEMNFKSDLIPNCSESRKVIFNKKEFFEGVCKFSLNREF
ncbi:MAG: hypothetical protein JW866_00350 [Ignavibacteriales bacterium]|nr:hypothetical protein [Ignavibacteriales bacterium]